MCISIPARQLSCSVAFRKERVEDFAQCVVCTATAEASGSPLLLLPSQAGDKPGFPRFKPSAVFDLLHDIKTEHPQRGLSL